MNKMMMIVPLVLAVSAQAVELQVKEPEYTVKNAHYAATFNQSRGGMLLKLQVGKVLKHVNGGFGFSFDPQPEKEYKRGHGAVTTVWQGSAKNAKVEVVKNAADGVVLRFSWDLNGMGETSQTLTFDDSPVVRVAQEVAWNKRAGRATYSINSTQVKQPNSRYYPEARDYLEVRSTYAQSIMPHWKYLNDGNDLAFGIIAPEDGDWERFQFGTVPKAVGWGNRATLMLNSRYLDSVPVPAKHVFNFAFVFTGDCQTAHKAAKAELKSLGAVNLCDLIIDKVCVGLGEGNGYSTTIVNNTEESRTVKAVTKIRWGLGQERTVKEETVQLKPFDNHHYRAEWQYDRDVEWGVAVELAIFDEQGKVIDRRADVTSVSDKIAAPVAFGVTNLGMSNQDGAEAGWAERFRRTYAGLAEFYCWHPATWDPSRKAGMSPEADDWEMMSESSGAYRQHVSKKFVKGFIDESHKRGVKMLTMITGLCNYRMAYAHPEKFQYTRNGQLAIYNGKVYDGERYAVAKLAPYTIEDATDWGNQMADSIDMFGWDGCRWDWGFRPWGSNDPLYAPVALEHPEKFEWFDYKGRSCYDLFPEDKVQEVTIKLQEAWDAAVRKRYPKFANCSNFNSSKRVAEASPESFASMGKIMEYALLEYLLSTNDNYPTYAIWAKNITEDTQRLRKYDTQTAIGYIFSFCEGAVGEQLARYTCMASGCKWDGGPDESAHWGAKRHSVPFSVRFAEYFFSTDFRLMDEARRAAEVSVKAADGRKLFYDQFVYERTNNGCREVVVNVLNADPDTYIMVRQDEPTPVALTANVKSAEGERLESAYALLPGIEPVAVKLTADQKGVVRLPRLEEAASFVFRFAK